MELFYRPAPPEKRLRKSRRTACPPYLKNSRPEKPIKLATEAQNLPAQSLYVSLGFQKLPEMDGDDLVFAL